ncbi:cation transporter [Microbulbifer hydrolyticus]|uniref:Cation diffusion facilitator family transporter n=1 Tax=Microbulbifer hydrolyticus TaxID=48074 RepID=A0A6P1T8V0_9GAMM|nr:cation transporter [Microbulbifer hydrolyticus]MBB5210956.1 cation diffusion facilitator family transporter [Microbulbifer hydrolyticus]QHQ38231.1 cation transporter [Microbulbifer hydrolyticus]
MSDCCESKSEALTQLQTGKRRRTLWIVLAINAVMFIAELGAGLLAQSQALIADSADNLGDTLVYGMSLFVVGKSIQWRAGAAFVKGLIQLGFALAVVASIIASLLGHAEPVGVVMLAVAAVALVGNLTCFVLLMRHRGEDVNMRSVWLCSRNDVIGNIGVILSGALVLWLDARWPDLLIASAVALIFLHTSYVVLRDAFRAWRQG